MRLGINYPWLHCGWDFGPPPFGLGARDADFSQIRADLTRLKGIGVDIVRWFVLADGLTYGTGADAPRRTPEGFRFTASAALHQSFLDDFTWLLELCRELGLSLLPVLLDHHFAFPGFDRNTSDARTLELWDRSPHRDLNPAQRLFAARERAARLPEGYVKGGRGDVLRDQRVAESFFERALVPLLTASRPYAQQIFAWELINEPEWITRGALSGLLARFDRSFRIPRGAILRFLQHGLGVIREHGFSATIGFARARTLRAWQNELPALTLNQFHYYPRFPWSRLPKADFGNGLPTLLGEFATRDGPLRRWPELPAARQDIAARLSLASARGYQAALPWSYRATDRATALERGAIEAALLAFGERELTPVATSTT